MIGVKSSCMPLASHLALQSIEASKYSSVPVHFVIKLFFIELYVYILMKVIHLMTVNTLESPACGEDV